MQDEIRALDGDRFGDVKKFIDYKKNNQLTSPIEVAQKLVLLIEKSEDFNSAVLDLRELEL